MVDPSLEVCPNFASKAFAPIREALMQASNESTQQVTERLIAAWDAEHNATEEAEPQRREQEEEKLRLAEEEAEQERREGEKKKPKMNDFD
ncbi:hypothetical protein BDN67DRAFT_1014441 [Paxillus ammoniavirescens]|nr:hypothetical protein BDN67DRAFT_1014441 [Paxillus ammoniavirescens]